MNGPHGPPPPPPPPPFLVPGMTPAPQAPSSHPSVPRAALKAPPRAQQTAPHAPPQMAPPAALAGAMMKDKKPFTYTPGGLDLSEISPTHEAPLQSRSFRILQHVVAAEPSAGAAKEPAEDELEEVSHQPVAAKIFTGNGVRGGPMGGSHSKPAHSAPVSRIASAPAPTRPQGGVGVWSPRAMPAPHNGQYGVSDM